MKVRANATYIFLPNGMDRMMPQHHGNTPAGTMVRVVNLPGAPKCNTMGQCHIETANGYFLGMVSTGSLVPVNSPEHRAWLQAQLPKVAA